MCYYVHPNNTTTFSLGDEMGQEMDRMQVDWTKYNLAKQSFSTCDTDGEDGLMWSEIDDCEVI